MTNLQDMADSWRRAGAYPLPKHPNRKAPMLKDWQAFAHAPCPADLSTDNWAGICVPMGGISRIEGLDFDADEADGHKVPGTAQASFSAYMQVLNAVAPALAAKVITGGFVETSPSGGAHVYIRSGAGEVPGNEKWARYPSGKTKIETRGTGGQFVVAPTPGYTVMVGTPDRIPVILAEERALLKRVAHDLNEKGEIEEPAAARELSEGGGEAYVSPRGWDGIFEDTGWDEVTPGMSNRTAGFDRAWNRPGHPGTVASGEYSAVSSEVCLMVFSTTAMGDFADAGIQGREQKNGARVYTMSEVYAALHGGASLAADDEAQFFGARYSSPLVPMTQPAGSAIVPAEYAIALPKTPIADLRPVDLHALMGGAL